MKLKSINTGQEFSKPSEALHWYCHSIACADCPLDGKVPDDQPCEAILVDDFEGTLRKMGLEVVHEKPRLCEALNVEVDEEFFVSDRAGKFWINLNGVALHENGMDTPDLLWLLEAINDPEIVRHLPLWTPDDISDAQAVLRLAPDADTVGRTSGHVVFVKQGGEVLFHVRATCFPSLKSGETAKLADIK